MRVLLFFAVLVLSSGSDLSAVGPDLITTGRHLFEQTWKHGNPTFGSDGLGPLFNGISCATCHNQGGIGGAGESKFNAQTIGIEHLKIVG
ncbi:MAG: di-heme oxidoredictase family protein, partial [Planctomycetota bacterium]